MPEAQVPADSDAIGSWNYRVVVSSAPTGEGDQKEEYRLIEAYYAADGETVVDYADAVAYGETLDWLRNDLQYMVRAFDKPVINEDDLPGKSGS